MKYLLNQLGSVDDIRCSLELLNPKNHQDIESVLKYLQSSIDDEKQNKNRATVIRMIKSKIKKINKKLG